MDDSYLRYAVDKHKKLRAVWLSEGSILQKTVAVVGYDAHEAVFALAGRKLPLTVPREDILSLGYARGDSGEG